MTVKNSTVSLPSSDFVRPVLKRQNARSCLLVRNVLGITSPTPTSSRSLENSVTLLQAKKTASNDDNQR